MKKYILLTALIITSINCFAQRNKSIYLNNSRLIRVAQDSMNAGHFHGCILLDSASKIMKSHIGKIKIKVWNEVTTDSAIYFTNDDSGHFDITLMPGIYEYTITKNNYEPIVIKNVHASGSHELYIKGVLMPGGGLNDYTEENGVIKKYVPTGPSYLAKFYYGDYSDTTVAFLWGQIFVNVVSLAGDTAIGFGNAILKFRNVTTGDTGSAHTDDASKFGIYFKDGQYDITITASGYKSILVKNYNAKEAQESYLDAVLEPGTDESVYSITNSGSLIKE